MTNKAQDKQELIRLAPSFKFPPYAFVPGKYPHPNQPGGHSHQQKKDEIQLQGKSPLQTNEFLHAIDLINFGYFWESHEVLEALWNACNRAEPYNSFLKGLIKIAAAGVKLNTDSQSAAQGHFHRSCEHFDEAFSDCKELGGFDHQFFKEFLKQEVQLPFKPIYPK